MEKLVAIIDNFPEYGERLAKFLNAGRNFPYRAVVFRAAEQAESYIKNGGVYAVLVPKTEEPQVIRMLAGTSVKLFCICETKEEQGAFSLYRYSSAKELERRLVAVKPEKKRIPTVGFFSPAGGNETEFLAGRIAGELGRKGKVLFISLFPFGINGREQGDGLSEVLYYLRQSGTDGKERVREIIQRGEHTDIIGPVRWYTDLRHVTKEDLRKLLQSDLWDREYRAFFVAVGMFDCVGQDILNCCDGILMPVWETAQGKAVREEFMRQIKESGETKLYAGIREFPVKETEGTVFEEAVQVAVKRGEEIIERCGGGDTQADDRTSGFVHGIDR